MHFAAADVILSSPLKKGAIWFRRDTRKPGCAPRMFVGLVKKRTKP